MLPAVSISPDLQRLLAEALAAQAALQQVRAVPFCGGVQGSPSLGLAGTTRPQGVDPPAPQRFFSQSEPMAAPGAAPATATPPAQPAPEPSRSFLGCMNDCLSNMGLPGLISALGIGICTRLTPVSPAAVAACLAAEFGIPLTAAAVCANRCWSLLQLPVVVPGVIPIMPGMFGPLLPSQPPSGIEEAPPPFEGPVPIPRPAPPPPPPPPF